MRVLLISQYEQNLRTNTEPSDKILYNHYNTYHLAVYNALRAKGHEVVLSSGLENDLEDKVKCSDVVFPIRHDFGYNNGDIFIELLCQKNHIKCVGNTSYSKFYDSDKIVGKLLAQKLKIPTPQYCLPYQIGDIRLKTPCLIKPRFSASSMNINDDMIFEKISDAMENLYLQKNVSDYFVEQFIPGVTATIGCIYNGKDLMLSHPYYLQSKTHRVVTYEDKRLGNLKRDYIHNKKIVSKMQYFAQKYFLAIQPCQIARMDFMLTRFGKLYFLEVNTTPNLGCKNKFTSSFVNKYFDSYDSFIDYLVTSSNESNR